MARGCSSVLRWGKPSQTTAHPLEWKSGASEVQKWTWHWCASSWCGWRQWWSSWGFLGTWSGLENPSLFGQLLNVNSPVRYHGPCCDPCFLLCKGKGLEGVVGAWGLQTSPLWETGANPMCHVGCRCTGDGQRGAKVFFSIRNVSGTVGM